MNERFYAFWIDPYDRYRGKSLVTSDERDVVSLRLRQDEESSSVRDLTVIWGRRLDLVPTQVVSSHKINWEGGS